MEENLYNNLCLKGPDGEEQDRLFEEDPCKLDGIDLSWTIEHRGKTKYSLLMVAAQENKPGSFRALLKLGADPTWKNNYGATVLQILAKRGRLSMVRECSAQVYRDQGEEIWLQWLNGRNNIGWTPLHASIQGVNLQAMNIWLLTMGADPTLGTIKSNWTAMHIAAGNKSFEIQKMVSQLESCELMTVVF